MANRWRCSQLIYIDVTGQYNPKIVLLFFSDELFRLDLKKLADWLFGSISIINFVRNTAELFSSVYEQFVPNIKWHFTWCRIERLSSAQYIYIWPATLTSIHTHHRTRNRQLVCSTHAAAGMGGTRVTVLVQPVVNVFLYNCQTVVSMCICRRCHVILLTVQCIYYNSGPVCQVTKSSRTIKNDTQIIIHATACLPTKEKKKKNKLQFYSYWQCGHKTSCCRLGAGAVVAAAGLRYSFSLFCFMFFRLFRVVFAVPQPAQLHTYSDCYFATCLVSQKP